MFELQSSGTISIKRVQLMLVGDGNAGKTTLVQRLTDNSFSEGLQQTDGIQMSNLLIEDVSFNVLDFAGQKQVIIIIYCILILLFFRISWFYYFN